MGALESLAAELLGQQSQELIAKENPYYQFVQPAQAFSQGALSAKTTGQDPRAELWNKAIAASVGGLLGGGLQGLGNSYQNTLTDRYQRALGQSLLGQESSAEGLSPGLFGAAKRGGKLFGAVRRAGSVEMGDAASMQTEQDINRAVIAANPSLFRLKSQGGSEAKPPEGVEGNLLAEQEAAINRLMDNGVPGGQAAETVGKTYAAKREELDRQYKRVEEAEKAGADLSAMVGQLRRALGEAGNTGAAGQLRQMAAGAAGLFGSESQQKKYAAGQDVESFSNEVVKQMGRAFKGPMSDRDVQIMLRAAPGLGTEESTNQEILNRWEYVAELQKTYAEFMRAAQAKGIPVSDAEGAWSKLKEQNPYVVKTAGGWQTNPAWLGGENPVGGDSAGTPSVGGMFNGQKVVSVKKVR